MKLKYETPLPPGLTEPALYIAYWNGSTWTKLDSTVNTVAKEVTASVSHFTIFAIRGISETTAQAAASTATVAASSSAAFGFSDLTAVPETVGPGENVTLSVRVINTGASEATGDVVLTINDKTNIQKEVTLEPGKSQPVSFTVSESDAGNYKISIGGLSTGFQVIKSASSAEQSSGLSTAIIVIIAAGCLLALAIALMGIFRRRPKS
jgi:hypothetical protein